MKNDFVSEYSSLKDCFECTLKGKQDIRQKYTLSLMLDIKQTDTPYLYAKKKRVYQKDIQFWHIFDTVASKRKKKKSSATALFSFNTDCVKRKRISFIDSCTTSKVARSSHKKKRMFSIPNTEYSLFERRKLNFSHLCNEFELQRMIEFLLKNNSRHKQKTLSDHETFHKHLYMQLFADSAKITPKIVKSISKLLEEYELYTKLDKNTIQSADFDLCDAFALRMNKLTDCKIVRPFLDFSRSILTTICISQKIPIYPDKSNQNLFYSRNRIRKQIVPSLQLFLNPKMEEAVFRFAELAYQEHELTSKLCRQNCLCL